jgi:hypothetical protein
MRKLPVAAVAAVAMMFMAAPARAADLESASIRNGESFEISPFSFYAMYARDVTLASARLVDQDGKSVPIPLGVVSRAKLVAFDLPVLAPHGYRLEWRVRDASGAENAHQVSFVIRGCKDPRAAPATDRKS